MDSPKFYYETLRELCISLCKQLELDYQELDLKDGILTIATTETITFKLLDQISELFKTESINLSSETRNEGYCETCSYEYSVNVITIKDLGVTIEN